MGAYQFGRILLFNCLLIITFNGLFAWQSFRAIASQPQLAILIGIALYFVQLLITRWVLGNLKGWLVQPFSGKSIRQAIGAMIGVELLTTGLIVTLTAHSKISLLESYWPNFLVIFLLNSLPGALCEEWLFRCLPLWFVRQSKPGYRAIWPCIGSVVVFTLIHTPAYLIQHERAFSDLSQVFVMGLFFLLVYLLTQNLFFTALFHGLTNKPVFLVESPYGWLYFYVSILLVSSGWAFQNWRHRRRPAVV